MTDINAITIRCDVCGEAFADDAALLEHIRNGVHVRELAHDGHPAKMNEQRWDSTPMPITKVRPMTKARIEQIPLFPKVREISRVIVHCSYTDWDKASVTAETIRRWHVDDNGWSDIGYHFVIQRSGYIEAGRDLERSGAHTRGFNHDSIGICLIGGRTRIPTDKQEPLLGDVSTASEWYSKEQLQALYSMLLIYKEAGLELAGHNQFTDHKECPCFLVPPFFNSVYEKSSPPLPVPPSPLLLEPKSEIELLQQRVTALERAVEALQNNR